MCVCVCERVRLGYMIVVSVYVCVCVRSKNGHNKSLAGDEKKPGELKKKNQDCVQHNTSHM